MEFKHIYVPAAGRSSYTSNITVNGGYSSSYTIVEGTTPPPPEPGPAPDKQYIIKTKRDTDLDNVDTNLYTIIENIDPYIYDNPDYRICLLTWKRHNKVGMKWTIPMFCGEWDATTGNWTENHPDGFHSTTKYKWADTWWPVHFEEKHQGYQESGVRWFSNPGSTKKVLSQMVDLKIHPTAIEFHNHNKKMRYGVAIFKHTGNGPAEWTRVSNIAEICIFAQNSTVPYPKIEVKQ